MFLSDELPAVTSRDLAFPEGCIECRIGDYIIRRHADSLWYVYRLEDILSVKRLVPSQTRPMTLIAEEDLLDSMTPAYFAEVQFLVSAFDLGHADEFLARQSIQNKAMIERAQGLLRAAREFSRTDCRVVRT